MLDEKLFYACMEYCTSFTKFMCAKEKKRRSIRTDPNELDMRMSLAFAKDELKHDFDNLKEASFTKMGGFTMERDGRGRYNICSENVIPKNSAVIRIASPDCKWNNIVADIFSDILTRVEF